MISLTEIHEKSESHPRTNKTQKSQNLFVNELYANPQSVLYPLTFFRFYDKLHA